MIRLPSRLSLAIAAVALMLTALVASPTNASPVRNLPTPSHHRALNTAAAADISKVVKYTRLRNRVYSPELGRFLSRDPIGFQGGWNLYGYAINNPVGRRDPSGLDSLDWGNVPQSVRKLYGDTAGGARVLQSLSQSTASRRPVDVRVNVSAGVGVTNYLVDNDTKVKTPMWYGMVNIPLKSRLYTGKGDPDPPSSAVDVPYIEPIIRDNLTLKGDIDPSIELLRGVTDYVWPESAAKRVVDVTIYRGTFDLRRRLGGFVEGCPQVPKLLNPKSILVPPSSETGTNYLD